MLVPGISGNNLLIIKIIMFNLFKAYLLLHMFVFFYRVNTMLANFDNM